GALFADARVLLLQLEVPDDAIRTAVLLARPHNTHIILNPAPARLVDAELSHDIDVLTPNEAEAYHLAGCANDTPREEVGAALLTRGPRAIIITCGSRGCVVFEANAEPVAIPAHDVRAVDTVGAGDAFNGGLAVALAEGKSLREA